MPRLGKTVACETCGVVFYKSRAELNRTIKNYCSLECRTIRKGTKIYARNAAAYAEHAGKIKRPRRCQRCNRIRILQRHHQDYSKPLDVEFICLECHNIDHRPVRIAIVESRRKHFAPCRCGRKAIARKMCRTCYARWRKRHSRVPCNVPGCDRFQYTRGLCSLHRQPYMNALDYADPPRRPGPVPRKKMS